MPHENGFMKLQGYYWIKQKDHPRSNTGYVKWSVLVLEEKLGRPLQDGEMVHHKDGDRLNDHPDNLEVTTRSLHMKQHRPIDAKWEQLKDWRQKRVKRSIKMWGQGFNMPQIAEELNTSHSRVHSYLMEVRKNNNGKRRQRKVLRFKDELERLV